MNSEIDVNLTYHINIQGKNLELTHDEAIELFNKLKSVLHIETYKPIVTEKFIVNPQYQWTPNWYTTT